MAAINWNSVTEVAPITNGYKGFVSGDDAFVTLQTTAIWVQGRGAIRCSRRLWHCHETKDLP